MEIISPTYALFLLQYLESKGRGGELLQRTGLTRDELCSGANVPMTSFQKLLINADRLSDEPIGGVIGKRADVMTLGPLGAAAATAPSIREGFQVIDAFSRLHATYARCQVVSSFRGLEVYFSFAKEVEETERFHVETTLFMIQDYLKMVLGHPVTDAEFYVRYGKPVYAELYKSWYQSLVTFDAEDNLILIPKKYLDLHSPFFNRDVWQQTLQLLSRQVQDYKKDGASLTLYVKSLLKSFDFPLPSLERMAERLHVSSRSLNRRLQQEQTTYREIKQEVVHQRAKDYLSETELTVEAISELLGYNDPANFRRSFKSREALSPNQYRLANSP